MLRRLTEAEALECLRAGGVVVFPTETSYGMGCRAFDPHAVARVVAAKVRPDGKPLPVLLPSIEALRKRQPETPLLLLAERFWPGPLTLVVPAFLGLPAVVTADTNMVGVRASGHPVARRLVLGLGEPMVATSANRSGRPPAACVEDCDASGLVGVDGVVDSGVVPGEHSTVVGLVNGELRFHRRGPISEAQVRAAWADARLR